MKVWEMNGAKKKKKGKKEMPLLLEVRLCRFVVITAE